MKTKIKMEILFIKTKSILRKDACDEIHKYGINILHSQVSAIDSSPAGIGPANPAAGPTSASQRKVKRKKRRSKSDNPQSKS